MEKQWKMEKRCNMTVVDNEDKALKHIAKPSFINLTMINDNFLIIRKLKNEVKLDKPFYVGVAVLDYSKFKMYNNHYGIFKNLYGDKVKLLTTDTDSWFYEIKTDDVCEDLFGENSKCKGYFDTSNLKKTNPYYSDKNKKVNRKLKCENGDNMIGKFVGLKSKNYAFSYMKEYEQFLNDGDK